MSTGLRANQVLDGVVDALKLDLDFLRSLWRMDFLCQPALLEQAVEDAAKADIVFLSVHGRNELPAGAISWLNLWLARKGTEPGALALLVDPSERDSPAAAETLGLLQPPPGRQGWKCFCTRVRFHPGGGTPINGDAGRLEKYD